MYKKDIILDNVFDQYENLNLFCFDKRKVFIR